MDSLARMLVNATEQLSAILQTFPKFDEQHKTIEELCRKAADLTQDSLSILDNAFITPLDREDILAIIAGMNAVMQAILELADRFRLYPLENLYPNLTDQSRNLLELAIQTEEIIASLRKKVTLSEIAVGSMRRLRTISDNIRSDRKQFLGELFHNGSGRVDPIDLVKKKDLHDLLEEALARLTEITEILARVILKNA